MSRKRKNIPSFTSGTQERAFKVAANARDVPYQSLIKVWLQEKAGDR